MEPPDTNNATQHIAEPSTMRSPPLAVPRLPHNRARKSSAGTTNLRIRRTRLRGPLRAPRWRCACRRQRGCKQRTQVSFPRTLCPVSAGATYSFFSSSMVMKVWAPLAGLAMLSCAHGGNSATPDSSVGSPAALVPSCLRVRARAEGGTEVDGYSRSPLPAGGVPQAPLSSVTHEGSYLQNLMEEDGILEHPRVEEPRE